MDSTPLAYGVTPIFWEYLSIPLNGFREAVAAGVLGGLIFQFH